MLLYIFRVSQDFLCQGCFGFCTTFLNSHLTFLLFSSLLQYTAEFVKDNLFQNTISKIKQLRTQAPTAGTCSASSSNNGSCKTQSNNRTRNCNANSKGEKRWLSGEDDSKEPKDAKESCPANNNNNNKLKVPNAVAAKSGTEVQDAQEKALSTTTTDSKLTTEVPEVTGGGSCVENLNSITSATSASTTTTTVSSTASSTCTTPSSSTSLSSSHCTESSTESLKKDDTYSSVNIRRTSLASAASKDKKEEVSGTGSGSGNGIPNDSCYIDVLQNINYTRLLTDQILAVDRQVVAHCKARTDMSGEPLCCFFPSLHCCNYPLCPFSQYCLYLLTFHALPPLFLMSILAS